MIIKTYWESQGWVRMAPDLVPWLCTHKPSLVPNPAVLVRGKQDTYTFIKENHHKAPQKHFSGTQMTQTSTVLRVRKAERCCLQCQSPPVQKSPFWSIYSALIHQVALLFPLIKYSFYIFTSLHLTVESTGFDDLSGKRGGCAHLQ